MDRTPWLSYLQPKYENVRSVCDTPVPLLGLCKTTKNDPIVVRENLPTRIGSGSGSAGLRCAIDASHLRSLQRTAKKNTEFEKIPFRTHKEVARLAREHNRFVGSVDPLISKRDGGLAQPFPAVEQITFDALIHTQLDVNVGLTLGGLVGQQVVAHAQNDGAN